MPLPSARRDERQVGTLRCHFVLLATLPGAARLGVDCGASLALGVRVVAAWLSCACAMCACTGGADEGAEDGVAAGGGAAGHSAPGGRWGWCRALRARDAASVGEGGGARMARGLPLLGTLAYQWGCMPLRPDVRRRGWRGCPNRAPVRRGGGVPGWPRRGSHSRCAPGCTGVGFGLWAVTGGHWPNSAATACVTVAPREEWVVRCGLVCGLGMTCFVLARMVSFGLLWGSIGGALLEV